MVVKQFSRRELLLITFFTGFSSCIIQVLLIREILTLCRGNEFIIGIVYASWFAGIYSGAGIRTSSGNKHLKKRISLSLLILPAIAFISIYSSYLIQIIIPRTAGTFYSFTTELTAAFFLTILPGFFTGFVFPPLVSLISDEIKDRSGGTVFGVESAGSFAGGIAFSFLLVDHMNPAGILSMLMLFSVFLFFHGNTVRLITMAIIPTLLLIFSEKIENRIISYTWNRTHSGILLQHNRTKFEAVTIESSADAVNIYQNGIFSYTLPDRYESRGIFHLVHSLTRPGDKIVLSGTGPGSLLHNLLKSDIDKLYYFDTDPEMWKITFPYMRNFYPGGENPKLILPGTELKNFLRQNSGKFDVIISIPPEPENLMINRFYTKEFYSLCEKHLTERGIIIASLHGFSDYMSPEKREFIASVYTAFSELFPHHMKTSGETIYFIGAKKEGILSAGPEQLVSGYVKKLREDKGIFEKEVMENFSHDELMMYFEKTQLRYFDNAVSSLTENSYSNSDLKPGAYWRNIILSASREQSVLYTIIKNRFIIPALILLATLIAFYDIRRRYGTSLMTNGIFIYITGFISISFMLIMVLLCQNYSGIVYHRISLINALYMLGLGAGSMILNYTHKIKLHHLLFFLGVALILIYVLSLYESWPLFWSLIPLFSLLSGAIFTLLFSYNTGNFYETASVLDSMDNYGAIAGSVLTVLFLIPVTGIQYTIFLNAVLLLSAFIYSFMTR